MPYPVLMAVGAALSAAGAGASIAASEQSKKAIQSVRNAEIERQKGYQSDAQALLQKNIKESDVTAAQADMAGGDTTRQNAYQQAQGQTMGAPLESQSGGNRMVKGEATRASDFSNAWTKIGNTTRAKLGGYAEWGTQQAGRTQRGNMAMAAISRNARGSADVLPIEAEQASHKGDKLAAVGQGLGIAGSVAGMAGAAGYGPSFGATQVVGQGPQIAPTMAAWSPAYSTPFASMNNPWATAAPMIRTY